MMKQKQDMTPHDTQTMKQIQNTPHHTQMKQIQYTTPYDTQTMKQIQNTTPHDTQTI